jgi:hypothetical protein
MCLSAFQHNKNLMKEAMREIEHRITASEKGEDYKGECQMIKV